LQRAPLPPPLPLIALPKTRGEKPACENQSFLRFWVPRFGGRRAVCARAEPSESPWQANVSRGCPHGLLVLLPRIASRFSGPLSPMGHHYPAQNDEGASRSPSGVEGGEACKAPPPHPPVWQCWGPRLHSARESTVRAKPPKAQAKPTTARGASLLPPFLGSLRHPPWGVSSVCAWEVGWVKNPPPAGALVFSSGGAAHRQGAPPRLTRFCLGVHQAPAQRVVR